MPWISIDEDRILIAIIGSVRALHFISVKITVSYSAGKLHQWVQ